MYRFFFNVKQAERLGAWRGGSLRGRDGVLM
jgi:hypothetical protein